MPPPAPASLPHWRFPLASVSRTVAPLQLSSVAMFSPCEDRRRPAKVEVAEVFTLVVSTPPAKVEVALPVTVSTPVENEVEVELVVVELSPVKFCSVDDPYESKFEALIEPLVMLPVLREVEKRLVDEAVPAKKLVLVELVVVDCKAVKFWRVEEPVARILAAVRSELMKPLVAVREEVKKLVEVD